MKLSHRSKLSILSIAVSVVTISGWLVLSGDYRERVHETGDPPQATPTPEFYYTVDGEPIRASKVKVFEAIGPHVSWNPANSQDVIDYVEGILQPPVPWSVAVARRVWADDLFVFDTYRESGMPTPTALPHSGKVVWAVGLRWDSIQPESLLALAGPVPPKDNTNGFTEVVLTVSLGGAIKSHMTLDRYLGSTDQLQSRARWVIEDILQLPEAPLPTPTP